MHGIANSSARKLQDLKSAVAPMPWSIGFGVDLWSGSISPNPVIKLTYNPLSHPDWHGFRKPAEADLTVVESPAGVSGADVWHGINLFYQHKQELKSSNAGQLGASAQAPEDVFEQYFRMHTNKS